MHIPSIHLPPTDKALEAHEGPMLPQALSAQYD